MTRQEFNDWRASDGQYANCLLGFATGERSGGIFVVDIDVGETGQPTEKTLEKLLSIDWPDGCRAQTPSGGEHRFFRGQDDGNRAKVDGCTIDVRGTGGYVVLYPDVKQKDPYIHYDDWLIPDSTAAITAFITKPRPSVVDSLQITEGDRNEQLFRFACGLRGQGLDYAQILTKVRDENGRTVPPLPDTEVQLLCGSAAKYEAPAGVAQHVVAPQVPLFHTTADVLALKLPPIEQICGPLFSAGITMMAGAAGVGKSLFALNVAAAIASGHHLETWKVPKARKTLYVDGEMSPQYLQGRVRSFQTGDMLQFLHLGLMNEQRFYTDLALPEHRNFFLQSAVFDAFEVFIFDTVSSLVHANEKVDIFSPQYWLQLEPFHQRFRAVGKTVLWVDNLNKQGQVFGTSAKHHKVDAMWLCERFKDKHVDATAAFIISQDKLRGDSEVATGVWEYYRNYGWRIR